VEVSLNESLHHSSTIINTHDRALALRAGQEAASGSTSSGVQMSVCQSGGSSSNSSSNRALPLYGRRGFSSLPPHQVVGLPALSPVSLS